MRLSNLKCDPRRRFGVDAVSQASKMNALALHLINQINQSFDATTEPIQLPNDEGIGFTQVGKGLFKPGATGLDAAEFVGENAFATRFLERVELQRQILVFARHSGVADQHALNFSLSHQTDRTRMAKATSGCSLSPQSASSCRKAPGTAQDRFVGRKRPQRSSKAPIPACHGGRPNPKQPFTIYRTLKPNLVMRP